MEPSRMAKTTIEWCNYTFNPWIGCTRVSPGCEHCYAEALARRAPALIYGPQKGQGGSRKRLATWGPQAPRRVTSAAYWQQPMRWNKAAQKAGERRRVFCASLADVFECRRDLDDIRWRLWDLIMRCDSLDWLLLTKRPERVMELAHPVWSARTEWRWGERVPEGYYQWPAHVWVGCTVEDQKRAEDRLDHLVQIPAPVLFVSYEPALEQVDFGPWLDRIQWLIVGGESGPGARPFDVAWMRKTISQCHTAKVPVFCKQLGANVRDRNDAGFDGQPGDAWDFGETDPCDMVEDSPNGFREEYQGAPVRIRLRDRKGGDMDEWPEELRVREFPEVGR